MRSITIQIPDDVWLRMKKLPHKNWEEILLDLLEIYVDKQAKKRSFHPSRELIEYWSERA